MNWQHLTEESQIEDIIQQSLQELIIIFKHSTRCGTSSIAKSRIERAEVPENISFYFLDVIRYRSVSNRVSEVFQVWHESPQVLLIKGGECVYDESHYAINMEEILEQVH